MSRDLITDREAAGKLSAEQALQYAVSCGMREDDLSGAGPEKGAPDFEFRVILRAFAALKPYLSGTWDDTAGQIAHAARRRLARGAGIRDTADIARDTAGILAGRLDPKKTDMTRLTACTIRIAAAVMSLMKRHRNAEMRYFAAETAAREWGCGARKWLPRHPDTADGDTAPSGNTNEAEKENAGENDPQIGQIPERQYKIGCATAISAWLNHEKAVRAPDPMLQNLLTALRRRESGDDKWYAFLLRNPEEIQFFDDYWPKSETGAWPGFNDFANFWTALAMREAGAPASAAGFLERAFADGAQASALWWLHADTAAEAGRFGDADDAIRHAMEQLPRAYAAPEKTDGNEFYEMPKDIWKNAVDAVAGKLARAALHHAMTSPCVEPPLIELAMMRGTPETVSEAALCIFDAEIPELGEKAAETLAQNPDARARFIDALAKRRDTEHLERTCTFYQKLCDAGANGPEMSLFDAITKLDAPDAAAEAAGRAIRQISNRECIFWTAIDLWIELCLKTGCYDQAVSGAAEAIALDSPRATRALLVLMAGMPREAYPMMQTILCENIGARATKNAFIRLKALENPYHALNEQIAREEERKNSADQNDRSPDDIALWMMPVPWQIAYRCARSGSDDKSPARDARRMDVLIAHGAAQKEIKNAPLPAQWIHAPQHHASDAFDI